MNVNLLLCSDVLSFCQFKSVNKTNEKKKANNVKVLFSFAIAKEWMVLNRIIITIIIDTLPSKQTNFIFRFLKQTSLFTVVTIPIINIRKG